MAKQRFQAPPREVVDSSRFEHPAFVAFAAHGDWLRSGHWPEIGELDARLAGAPHPFSARPLRFVEQTPALLADGLHYEARILREGRIATRARNWHDLFNALMWLERRALKAAMNLRQVADLGVTGPGQRSRGQCALTHFDEAGALVVLPDADMLACWDAHDWVGLFLRHRDAWLEGRARVILIGHALLERALVPNLLLTAKCLAWLDPEPVSDVSVMRRVAESIAAGVLLRDPQELRPLPLSGLPGWHADAGEARFLRDGECFRPLRPGRTYPPPAGPARCAGSA